jgi:hypothetical protein
MNYIESKIELLRSKNSDPPPRISNSRFNENSNVLKIDYLKFENITSSKVYANVQVGLNMKETDIRGESNPAWELNTEF